MPEADDLSRLETTARDTSEGDDTLPTYVVEKVEEGNIEEGKEVEER